MSTTIGIKERRQLGIDLASHEAANVLCDAIEDASDAVVAVDQFLLIHLGDPDAGDIGTIMLPPFDHAVTLLNVKLLALGSFAGVDASNTVAITLKDEDENTIVTKTYSNSPAPTDNGANDLGSLNGTHKLLADNEAPQLTITCGETADPPLMTLQIRYRYR